MKSMSIDPYRWKDFGKTTPRVTVHVELDGDETSISLFRKVWANNERTPVFSGNVGELLQSCIRQLWAGPSSCGQGWPVRQSMQVSVPSCTTYDEKPGRALSGDVLHLWCTLHQIEMSLKPVQRRFLVDQLTLGISDFWSKTFRLRSSEILHGFLWREARLLSRPLPLLSEGYPAFLAVVDLPFE